VEAVRSARGTNDFPGNFKTFKPKENIMKKLALIAFVLIFAAGTATAQQGGPGNGNGNGGGKGGNSQVGGGYGDPVERLTELLGLTDQQAIDIGLIFEDAQIAREAAREAARVEAEAHRALVHDAILEVLDDDQDIIFEEHKAQREALKQAIQEMRNERGFGGGGNGRGTGDCNG
jgi:hypothetical protein